jgi:hypothetical protein
VTRRLLEVSRMKNSLETCSIWSFARVLTLATSHQCGA